MCTAEKKNGRVAIYCLTLSTWKRCPGASVHEWILYRNPGCVEEGNGLGGRTGNRGRREGSQAELSRPMTSQVEPLRSKQQAESQERR